MNFQENVEVKAREAVFGNKKNNNHAERLWRLDQFKKLKTRLWMNFQENVEVKAKEAVLYMYINCEKV